MKDYKFQQIICPHCGHHVMIELDISGGDQDYYDECAACCREIHFNLHIDRVYNKVELNIDSDDEQVF